MGMTEERTESPVPKTDLLNLPIQPKAELLLPQFSSSTILIP